MAYGVLIGQVIGMAFFHDVHIFEVISMKSFRFIIAILLLLATSLAFGAQVIFTEAADKVRFEQYTSGTLVLHRLPTPGISVFPGGNCTNLTTPGGIEIANRFIAFYLFVKSNNRTYFVIYETTTCQIISFGMDG